VCPLCLSLIQVVLIEPHFDSYSVVVEVAGGKPVYVALKPGAGLDSKDANNWVLDREEFERAFSSKTKALMINTPHNPIGKVFSQEELEFIIAGVCKKHDVLVISDEVYERCVFSGYDHHRIANIEGMWDRTLTIGSAGKSFSMTGYKLGWTLGPEELVKKVQAIHQTAIYSAPTITQEAVAIAVEREVRLRGSEDSYSVQLPKIMEAGCTKLITKCAEVGLDSVVPHGGYVMLLDTAPLGLEFDTTEVPYDVQCVKWLTEHKHFATIPVSVFFGESKYISEKYIRLCFAKSEQSLDAACTIIDTIRE